MVIAIITAARRRTVAAAAVADHRATEDKGTARPERLRQMNRASSLW
jgi:hypothetical protein